MKRFGKFLCCIGIHSPLPYVHHYGYPQTTCARCGRALTADLHGHWFETGDADVQQERAKAYDPVAWDASFDPKEFDAAETAQEQRRP